MQASQVWTPLQDFYQMQSKLLAQDSAEKMEADSAQKTEVSLAKILRNMSGRTAETPWRLHLSFTRDSYPHGPLQPVFILS